MQVCLTETELWMAVPHTQVQYPLPTWFDVELRRLDVRTTPDLQLFTPSDKVSVRDASASQKETDVEKYLTGWRLHALTLGCAPLLCTRLHAPVFTPQQLVPEPSSVGDRVDRCQYCAYLNHG